MGVTRGESVAGTCPTLRKVVLGESVAPGRYPQNNDSFNRASIVLGLQTLEL